ncbi:non-canonical purine NTP pyrophosphatase [Alphaproteobacteria bacterium]|nr:non-canonical purine NTP pyrophosphatase [Alphaproteobacteria bacterium]
MNKEKVLLASSNQGKITEFLFYINYFKIFKDFEIVTLDNFPNITDPEEDKLTFTGNANLKSSYFYSKSKLSSLSDDSGFIIDGSENFPGVKTARYAKENGGISEAIKKLFQEYNEKDTIPITFHCSLSYKSHDREISATGSVKGKLINTSAGDNGFGYDPYFIPINNNKTFAEMEREQKLLHSHRFYAFQDLALKII